MVRRIDEHCDRTVEALLIYAWQTFVEISRERRACASHICRDLGSLRPLCNLLISHASLVPPALAHRQISPRFPVPIYYHSYRADVGPIAGHVRYLPIYKSR